VSDISPPASRPASQIARPSPQVSSSTPKIFHPHAMTRPLTILVVDDDADGRLLIEHRLRKAFEDCAVVACTGPSEALSLLRGRAFDAIITDNQFAGESGSELISQARRRGVSCPILMVTASDNPQVQRDAYAAGATKIFMGGRGDFTEFLRPLLIPATAERPAGPAIGG
jgi:CheY-like chemotaxis protein